MAERSQDRKRQDADHCRLLLSFAARVAVSRWLPFGGRGLRRAGWLRRGTGFDGDGRVA